jgi:hypothetical protein
MDNWRPLNCTCDGRGPACPCCLAAYAIVMRRNHPDTLSVGMLRRRSPELTGREAAILIETTKYLDICYEKGRR